ncbi:MAG TPA: DUF3426 domain-containing protein [Pseudomonadales bacterium]|nr:DUF3426 domain-containing protein [Pseudomonadales bacterium]
MSELIFTRCPHCSTLFRLTPQQLSAAKGAVRCGKCFQVFNAMQNVVDATSLQASGREIPRPEKKPLDFSTPAPEPSTSGIPAFSSIELPPTETPNTAPPPPKVSENIFASDSAFAIEEDPLFAPEKKKKPKVQDDAWAEALLRELDSESGQVPASSAEPDYSSSKTHLDFIQNEGDDYFGAALEARGASQRNLDEELSESFRSLTGTSFGTPAGKGLELPDLDAHEPSLDADESWAQAMLKELENEDKKTPAELALIPSEKDKEKEKAAKKTGGEKRAEKKQSVKDELESFDFDSLFQEEMSSLAAPPTDPIVSAPVQKDNLFDFQPTEPSPLMDKLGPASGHEFTPPAPRQSKSSAGKQLMWGVLSLLLVAVMFGQYLYFNFAKLSQESAWRPWYEKACTVLKCTLPPLIDTSQIRSRNMTLSERNGSYVVDFLVKNHASFAQPFPNLELRFSDINGKIVARRLFKPSEYVRGELTGAKLMPAGVDIRFSIEVVKPSPDAVNFDLNFYPATE